MAMDFNKWNHPIYKKLRDDKAKLWSFSVASSYENCPHEYYLSRVLKLKGQDNIYTQAGTLSHDLLEKHYIEGTSREEMLRQFNIGMMEIDLKGYKFASEKIERGFVDNMRLYFSSFTTDSNIKECETFVSMPLWIYDNKLIDNYFQGWIDAVLEKDGEISLGDFKSSTIFTGKDLIKKSRQLIMYAIAYEYMYKKPVKSIFFDFLKYIEATYIDGKGKEKKKIVERRDLHMVDNIVSTDKAYVFVELTDEIKQETIEWFLGMIHTINNDEVYAKGGDCGNNSFFCKTLCGVKAHCEFVLTK